MLTFCFIYLANDHGEHKYTNSTERTTTAVPKDGKFAINTVGSNSNTPSSTMTTKTIDNQTTTTKYEKTTTPGNYHSSDRLPTLNHHSTTTAMPTVGAPSSGDSQRHFDALSFMGIIKFNIK